MTYRVDISPDYYNPAKDEAKLREAMRDPSPFDGWPSRWRRCLAAEVVEQAETIITLRGHLEIARAALTASGESMAIELRVRETLKEHIHDLSKYADHMHGCTYPASTCTCGFLELMQKGIAR